MRLALIVGHTPDSPGATSVDGTSEYAFNSGIARLLTAKGEAPGQPEPGPADGAARRRRGPTPARVPESSRSC